MVRSLPGLGDLLCAVPALQSLRAACPQAHITWVGLPGTEWFAQRFPALLDAFLAFPGYPGIPEGWQSAQATVDFLAQTQANPFDLVIQMHGNGSAMNAFVALIGAQARAGFYLPGQYCPQPESFLPYPEGVPEVVRSQQLMTFLGAPPQSSEMSFPITPIEQQRYQSLADLHDLRPSSYVCVHPGASDDSRRWSSASFAQVADHVAAKGYRVVLTGTSAEQPLVQEVQRQMYTPCLNLVGRTDLGTLAALLQNAALLICNDTGVSHLAAALQVPSVVIFSNSEVNRWAPLNRQIHRVIDSRESGMATTAAVLMQINEQLRGVPQPASAEEVSHAV